jgi:FkbM family methyltransferase
VVNFDTLAEPRRLEVDGLIEWWVVKGDNAFEDIVRGWRQSNKDKWLQHTPKRDVVVQAGGYNGVYPRLFSQIFKTVYTFEPHPLSFYCLGRNCDVDNIIKINAVLGDSHTLVTIQDFQTSNPGLNKVTNNPAINMVPQFMIDDLALEACDLIQLDVEGYEINVLRGAKETSDKVKPTISCERGDGTIRDFLACFGYKEVDKTFDDVIYKA